MKTSILSFPLYFMLLLLFVASCNNIFDDVEVSALDNQYLVKAELVQSYTESEINGYLNLATLGYPEHADKFEQINNSISSGVEVYNIVYSTTFNGNKVQASGVVCIPDSFGSYPVISYQNGTNTLHSAAPSADMNNNLFKILQMMGSTGFIISMPDYLGFGESEDMFHPYLHKESTVQTVCDMLRAINEMLKDHENTDWNKDVYLSGYSQGGWASMALQKTIETNYSEEFHLKASACGAGPYNLRTINEYVVSREEYPQPYFLGYIFNSYLNLGLTTPITEVFHSPYAEKIPTLYNGSNSPDEINGQLTNSVSELFTADYLSNWLTGEKYQPILNMLEKNSTTAYATQTPTLLLHGTQDNYVTPEVSHNLYNNFISLGVSTDLVSFIQMEGEDHSSGIVPSGLQSMLWFLEIKGVF